MLLRSEHVGVRAPNERAQQACVWLVEIGPDLMDLALLSAAERERFAAFRRPVHAIEFAATRCVLKRILGLALDCDPCRVRLATDLSGRPRLIDEDRQIGFSVAHAGTLCLIATAPGGMIGVDLEHGSALSDLASIESWLDRVGAPPAMPLLRRWVRLEALAKAVGTGLGEIDSNGLRVPATLRVEDVPVPPDWAGAVALPTWCGPVKRLRWEAEAFESRL